MRRALDSVATLLALAGGALLAGLAALTTVSIVGRWLASQPVTGDVELVQLGVAAAIALFLPYCQLHGSHLIVDFFTARSSGTSQRLLDTIAARATGAVLLLLAWRATIGVIELRAAGETTMVLGVPLWMPYAVMIPGLALAGIAGLVQQVSREPRAGAT